ncbi:hypothetical protein RO3G_08560 [Rhizopus delemar RA 99-880]|uniref:O-fucosyltransferase family protein n=1 Tax=Rhizopus delemar (strain RA 99-880 / ATCC MYA-4621 / FGSC 9543 / NRRL 43880) TaxID=246409 RepID=I1C5X5_RHIO9|nr:hypothetical protein RO3G_08560 [Rhizopus delemar RA 99-880]|eukprot:EIE83855.1 hypothetical protein RO3G_08560 [Rhizopus delemar RA 99-880]
MQHNQRYLAYLPHSGLSNQRIELANALLLAYMLNRTLLIPPAFFGTVFGWMPREELMSRLEWLTTPKPFNLLCQSPTPKKLASYIQQSRCEEYKHLGILHWSELHDLSPLLVDIQYQFQNIMSMKSIQENLGLSDDDIYKHEDAHLKEKLLFLGGVFGSTRLNVVDPKLKKMQEKIAHALHYRLDTSLGITAQSIVDYMGGKGSFMSLHFRTKDNPFKKNVSINLENFVKNMTEIVGEHESEECIKILPKDIEMTVGKKVNVYIATDYRDPKGKNSTLLPWFQEFPCTTVLSDIPTDLFAPLDDSRDMVSPSKSFKNFLIPLVDAIVAAHGKSILITPRSTFSKYIEELHQVWVS